MGSCGRGRVSYQGKFTVVRAGISRQEWGFAVLQRFPIIPLTVPGIYWFPSHHDNTCGGQGHESFRRATATQILGRRKTPINIEINHNVQRHNTLNEMIQVDHHIVTNHSESLKNLKRLIAYFLPPSPTQSRGVNKG